VSKQYIDFRPVQGMSEFINKAAFAQPGVSHDRYELSVYRQHFFETGKKRGEFMGFGNTEKG
jgi:hypothetical protein